LVTLDEKQWAHEVLNHAQFFERFGGLTPNELINIQNELMTHYGSKG